MQLISKLEFFLGSLIFRGGVLGKEGFFDKNKYIILISFLAGFFANLTDICNLKYGIDTEVAVYNSYVRMMIETNRYSSAFLMYIFPFLQHSVISQISGIFFLSIICVISVYKLDVPDIAKIIFSILVITYPSFAFLNYFTFQYSYNLLALLIGMCGYIALTNFYEKGNFLRLLIAILFLTFAIASYQVNFSPFLICGVVYIFFSYMKSNDLKKSFKELLILLFVILSSFLLYYFICKVISGEIIGYHSSRISWISDNDINKVLSNFFTSLYRQIVGIRNYAGFINIVPTLFFIIFSIYYIKKSKKNILFILALFFAFFSIIFLFGKSLPQRVEIGLPFFSGFSFLIVYLILRNNILKAFVIASALIVFFLHSGYISKQQQAQLIQYENDKLVVARILNLIYDKAPNVYQGEKQLIFIGKLSLNNRHPIFKNAKDTFAGSFFNWFDDDINGRILFFSYLQGLPTNVLLLTDANKKQEARELAKHMPTYPARDCVHIEDDYIIVKLGDVE